MFLSAECAEYVPGYAILKISPILTDMEIISIIFGGSFATTTELRTLTFLEICQRETRKAEPDNDERAIGRCNFRKVCRS